MIVGTLCGTGTPPGAPAPVITASIQVILKGTPSTWPSASSQPSSERWPPRLSSPPTSPPPRFLALAATQFREVRSIERETLLNLEESELVPRGAAYIEGSPGCLKPATTSRCSQASLQASAPSWPERSRGAVSGGRGGRRRRLAAVVVLRGGGEGPHVGDLAEVEIVPIEFDGPLLTVAGVVLMNIGLEEPRRAVPGGGARGADHAEESRCQGDPR